MALPRPATANLCARDIAAYSDAELDQYLEAYGRVISVEDPENLPADFIKRLRARTGAGDASQSHPIDLDLVSARLEEVPTDRDTLPQRYPSVSSTESIDDEEYHRDQLERETEDYNELVNIGGRPSHPISLGYDAASNLEEYREVLSFWNSSSGDPYGWMVFKSQLYQWKKFRESQRRMRNDGPLEVGSVFPALPARPGRFTSYCLRLYKRLTRHGFERSFQLNEDPDRQDKLVTWIEYLGFEYVEYDKHAKIMKRLQQRYDEAWKKLVDSEVLKPFETEESIWTFGIGVQMKNEESEATKGVESATSTVQSTQKILLETQSAGPSKFVLSRLEQKLSAAKSKLAIAKKSLEWFRRRRQLIVDFHDQTKPYCIAKDDAASQSILLRWILKQFPLIDLELNSTKVTESDLTAENFRRQRNLKRNRADDPNEEPAWKWKRQDGENHTLLESKVRVLAV